MPAISTGRECINSAHVHFDKRKNEMFRFFLLKIKIWTKFLEKTKTKKKTSSQQNLNILWNNFFFLISFYFCCYSCIISEKGNLLWFCSCSLIYFQLAFILEMAFVRKFSYMFECQKIISSQQNAIVQNCAGFI